MDQVEEMVIVGGGICGLATALALRRYFFLILLHIYLYELTTTLAYLEISMIGRVLKVWF